MDDHRSELAWVVTVPVPCGHCSEETPESVASLVEIAETTCAACGAILRLDTDEWARFREAMEEVCVGKFAPIAPIKKFP